MHAAPDPGAAAAAAAGWCAARLAGIPAAERTIVILTGAGISAESGLATFRGPDGLWEGHRVEDVATPEAFARQPELVHRFYNERRRRLQRVQPNAGHVALARLARGWPAPVHLITQNVDDLHERGGAPSVIHMHGQLTQLRNRVTGEILAWSGDCWESTPCPRSGATGQLRPHIVWFGEAILETEAIDAALERPALFLCAGTAGAVWPAAGFAGLARERGAAAVEFNLEPTQISDRFHRVVRGAAGETLPAFVDALLDGV